MEYTSKEVYEYVSKKTKDPIVERKKCRMSWQDFPIYQSDLDFYDRVSPTFDVDESFAKDFFEKNSDVKDHFEYKDWKLKAKYPTPTLCPEERSRRRFSFSNLCSLYKRNDSSSWKWIISIYSPDKPYIVYDYNFWNTYSWTIVERGVDWDFNDNFSYLIQNTPIPNAQIFNCENSDYTNQSRNMKNSYMCFCAVTAEDCLYGYLWVYDCVSCIDCTAIDHCEFCYDSIKLNHCTWVFHSQSCSDCSNSSYLINCVWCHDCFNCSNMVNKSYCINNKQYSKEEYQNLIKNAKRENLWDIVYEWCKQKESENCVWNGIYWCKNSIFCDEVTASENMKYVIDCPKMTDVYDGLWTWSKLCIETYISWNSYHSWIIYNSRYNKESRYLLYSDNCTNCFGCVWLKDKSYCVYNKQYTKEEYNKIVPEVIAWMIRKGQRWEYFDPQLSYFWYNETMAMTYYPITKQEALKMWYKRSDYELPAPKVEKTVLWENLPKVWCKTIQEKKPEFLQKLVNYAIICEVSKKPFRVTKQELDFYVKHNLPLPTKHPDVRHQERFEKKPFHIMHLVHCDKCGEEMLSVHLSWKWKKVLCEKCFYEES